MLSINEKINYKDRGGFLVISPNEDGFMLEDKISTFIFYRVEAKKFKSINEAVPRLSKEFDTDNQNTYAVREQIKALMEEPLKHDVVVMRQWDSLQKEYLCCQHIKREIF